MNQEQNKNGFDVTAALPMSTSIDQLLHVESRSLRKYGFKTVLGCSDISQLEKVYGDEVTKAVLANTKCKILYRTEE